ncbi:cyclic nucleotide-binding domain-containing protein [Marispirochaeta aestuarii]|uniref:cyclic nucleotide-binding domain-containing protein n=1 Tax=Marispirochaeta aestuarii TaxID=1963862 RepID=UPI0029C7A9AF|nr:cyclic nucleotide-binding domain-containing protein [Marispirochaeta aestuarii]
MPKAINFKANSVVYFRGDVSEKIYILKSGRVNLRSNDIETGQEINEQIKTGEFFGVKSSLGKYPREETAMVLSDSTMLVFSVPEFEQVVLKNTRIIMKMLKVFSNQLRRIHQQVQNLISTSDSETDPEDGLFQIGEYYLKNKRYRQALYTFQRYLLYYPHGKYAEEATANISLAEQYSQRNVPLREENPNEVRPAARGAGLSAGAREYYDAVSLFSQQRYDEALKQFKLIVEKGDDDEYVAKSYYEMGRCLFSLNKNTETVSHFTGLIQRYPKHPDLADALFYVASAYDKEGSATKARGLFTKILNMTTEDNPVNRKSRKALKSLEGRG